MPNRRELVCKVVCKRRAQALPAPQEGAQQTVCVCVLAHKPKALEVCITASAKGGYAHLADHRNNRRCVDADAGNDDGQGVGMRAWADMISDDRNV